jgi:hypothetical protein
MNKNSVTAPRLDRTIQFFMALFIFQGIVAVICLFVIAKDPSNIWLMGLSRSRFFLVLIMVGISGVMLFTLMGFSLREPWRDFLSSKIKSQLDQPRTAQVWVIILGAGVGLGIIAIFNLLFSENEFIRTIVIRLAPIILFGSGVSISALLLFPRHSAGIRQLEANIQQKINRGLRTNQPLNHNIRDLFIILGLIGVLFGIRKLIGTFVIDDAWITFNYSKNLALGNGLTWEPNALARTEGYSNFLEVILIAGAFKLNLDPVIVAQSLGLAATLTVISGLYFHLKTITRTRLAGLIPVLLYSIHPFTTIHTWSGLETQLFAALNTLVFIIFWQLWRRDSQETSLKPLFGPWALAFLSFLVTITRTEGVGLGLITMVLASLFLWRRNPSGWRWAAAGYGSAVAAYFIFRGLYFGTLITGPYFVKASDRMLFFGLTSFEFLSAGKGFILDFPLGIFGLVFLPIGVYLGTKRLFRKDITKQPETIILLLSILQLLGLLFVYSRTNMIQNFAARFFFQTTVQQIYIIAIAGASIYRGWQTFVLEPKKQILAGFAFLLISGYLGWATFLWAGQTPYLVKSYQKFVQSYNNQQHAAQAIAETLNQFPQLDNEWVITIVDSGILPYYAEMNTLGGDGLTDQNLSALVPPVDKKERPYAEYVFQHHPGVFVIEVYGSWMDPHHSALVCDTRFAQYNFVGGVKRNLGYTYNVYLRKDLPKYPAIAQEISNLVAPQQQWQVTFDNPQDTCPH